MGSLGKWGVESLKTCGGLGFGVYFGFGLSAALSPKPSTLDPRPSTLNSTSARVWLWVRWGEGGRLQDSSDVVSGQKSLKVWGLGFWV